jgi:hypothetical protein
MASKHLKKVKPRHQSSSGSSGRPWLMVLLVCVWISVVQIHLQIYSSSVLADSSREHESAAPPIVCETVRPDTNTNTNTNTTIPLRTSLLRVDKTKLASSNNKTKNVVVYVCGGGAYCEATLDSIQHLRTDGGYHGDVVLIYNVRVNKKGEPNPDKTAESVLEKLRTMPKVTIFMDRDLLDDAVVVVKGNGQQQHPAADLDYLKHPPPIPKCLKGHRSKKFSHQAKYSKLLIYHPAIANRWDRVLYLDACVTYMEPHVDLLFDIPALKGHLLAMPDPWIWRKKHMSSSLNRCADQSATKALTRWLGGKRLDELGYINSALILYDATIVRNYQTTEVPSEAATLLELLTTFHTLTPAFTGGDQVIQTVYWRHIREQYSTMPLTLVDSNLVPFEFAVRLKDEPHILIGANGERPVCKRRATTNYQLSTATRLFNNNSTFS